MSNIAARWNALDSFIYKIESGVTGVLNVVKEEKEELPDPEEMIAAVTKQLKEENDVLKQLQFPGKILFIEGKYYCPHCKNEITRELIDDYQAKYCIGCGKRITKFVPYYEKYAINADQKCPDNN